MRKLLEEKKRQYKTSKTKFNVEAETLAEQDA
jgi:hypothetical protein